MLHFSLHALTERLAEWAPDVDPQVLCDEIDSGEAKLVRSGGAGWVYRSPSTGLGLVVRDDVVVTVLPSELINADLRRQPSQRKARQRRARQLKSSKETKFKSAFADVSNLVLKAALQAVEPNLRKYWPGVKLKRTIIYDSGIACISRGPIDLWIDPRFGEPISYIKNGEEYPLISWSEIV